MASNSNYITRDLISHTRRVCSLYKRMLRDVDWWEEDFWEGRFKKLILRSEFDKNKNIKDLREAKALLQKAEEKFADEQHPVHRWGNPYHPFSKEGISYERNLLSPDWVMDRYHPLEKAQYPYYFAKREEMKEEYIRMWRKKMMKDTVKEKHEAHEH